MTDVELFDDFPPRYHAYALREHRWARGDWQLLPWLGRTVPTPGRAPPQPAAGPGAVEDPRQPPAEPRPAGLDGPAGPGLDGPPGVPLALDGVRPGGPGPADPPARPGLGRLGDPGRVDLADPRDRAQPSRPRAGQSLLWIAFLADQARRLVDATLRTLHRLFVSKRKLLEWETAAATEHRLGTGLGNFIRTMWPSPAWALGLGVLVGLVNPSALPAALPVLLAWFVAPVVAYWVSRPRRAVESPLTDPERAELRRIARKTWHFFETFVGDADHWLPPDNYQEDSISSGGRVAHRTSPTNKGMLLLSTLAAHDLGYLGLRTLLDRLEKTFDTFDRMEKYEGHLYNWYNTQTLRTLPPNYVSTVDSGNFLGCLVTLKQGMREKLASPSPAPGPSMAWRTPWRSWSRTSGSADPPGRARSTRRSTGRSPRSGGCSGRGPRPTSRLGRPARPAGMVDDRAGQPGPGPDRGGPEHPGALGVVRPAAGGPDPRPAGRGRLGHALGRRAPVGRGVGPGGGPPKRSEELDRSWLALRSTLVAPGSPAELARRADDRGGRPDPPRIERPRGGGARPGDREPSASWPRRPGPRPPPTWPRGARGSPSGPSGWARGWTSSSCTRKTATCSRSARTWRWAARRLVLRPDGLRGLPDELPGGLPGGGPPPPLVPARPAVHRGGGPGRAALLGRLDVRVPDAPPAAPAR